MENLVEAIREAVAQLDPANDEHWTKAEGLPEVKPVRVLTNDASISRADITAAMPQFNREAARNAASEPQRPETATSEEAQITAAPEPAVANPTEANADEDAEENFEAFTTEHDVIVDWGQDVHFRGLVMSIVIKLGPAHRMVSDAQKLDEIMEFIGQWEIKHQQIVFEMLRSLAESLPEQIASGAYKAEIARAMEVVTTGKHVPPPIVGADKEAQEAALAQTMAAVTSMSRPGEAGPDPQAMGHVDDSGATAEQIAAKQALYGNTDGVREPDG